MKAVFTLIPKIYGFCIRSLVIIEILGTRTSGLVKVALGLKRFINASNIHHSEENILH